MSDNKQFCCPECGGQLKAWADLDAEVSWLVTPSGGLQKRVIRNTYQSDGRSGIECSQCDWEFDGDESVSKKLAKLAEKACDKQCEIDFLAPTAKPSRE